MKINILLWYSLLSLDEKDNNFIISFFKKSCDLIRKDLIRDNRDLDINLQFIDIKKGEEGIQRLKNKIDALDGLIITNGHSVKKYNPKILDNLKEKEFLYFSGIGAEDFKKLDDNFKPNIIRTSRANQLGKLNFLTKQINNYYKIYFFHEGKRLHEKITNLFSNIQNKKFEIFEISDEESCNRGVSNLKNLNNNEVVILDVGLSKIRIFFEFFNNEKNNANVINLFGSLEKRFTQLKFNLIQLSGTQSFPTLAFEDLVTKCFDHDPSHSQKTLVLDSVYRLEIPLLINEAINKIRKEDDISKITLAKIKEKILTFDGKSDLFIGKKLIYGFDNDAKNIFKDSFAYVFPNSLQIKDYEIPKIYYPTQISSIDDEIISKNVIFTYIDLLSASNIDIKTKSWTAEFHLDIVSEEVEPMRLIEFTNLSSVQSKSEIRKIWERKSSKDKSITTRYHIVANFSYFALADNYPFDWQCIYIGLRPTDGNKSILQPIPYEFIDNDFEINEWKIEKSFSGIKNRKNYIYNDADLQRNVIALSENRIGWVVKRKNTATLLKIGIPIFFLFFLVYYSAFLSFEDSKQTIGTLTTTFLSAIALYFSVEKPEPKKMTIIDIIFIWFYLLNGITIILFGLSGFISQDVYNFISNAMKLLIPVSLIGLVSYLFKRVKKNRRDIFLDRDG